jgi:outer membrane protein assembly complex protein YaeT
VIGNIRLLWVVWAALAAVCLAAQAAEEPAAAPSTVLEVRVEGNQRLSAEAVLSHVRIRAEAPFDESVVKADEQRLLETRQFTNVAVTKTVTDKGVIVTFTVAERPGVVEIQFVGNQAVKTADLMKNLTFGVGDPLDRFSVESGRKAIEASYRDKGYPQVEVTVDADALKEGKVVYTIREGPKTLVRRIRFEGNTHFGWLKLRTSIGSSERFWPFITGVLDEDQIRHDTDTLRNLYVEDGFLDAEVSHRLDISPDKSRAVLTFLIKEGPRYRVQNTLLKGNTVFSDADLIARLSLQPDAFFTAQGLQHDIKAIGDAYGELGYIHAVVRASKQFPAPLPQDVAAPPPLVNIVYNITEDDQYRVGRIIIRGNAVTQDRVVRREMRFFPEQLYNTVAAEESRKRLMETGLFNKVTIMPEGNAPAVRDAAVVVEEAQTGQIMLGVGVSSNSGLLGNVTYTQKNFDIFAWPGRQRKWTDAWKGAGQTLTISVEPGTELNQAYIDWLEPRLWDKQYSLGQRVYFFDRKRETYREERVGYVPSFGHRFANGWYGEVSGRIEDVHIGNLDSDAPPEVRDVEGDNFLAGPKVTFTRDRTDSRWMPSTGDRFQISAEQMAGAFTFTDVSADYRFYRTLWTDALDRKHILATRVMAGKIFGDAPVFEKYYGGGIGSLRGFKYRGISPRSEGTDEQIGGDFILLAGTEYTFPLIGDMLRGVVFLDTGTVEKNFEITNYRSSAGFGVRWMIPLLGQVPMSFDLGFPMTKSSEDDTQIFSFSVGWTF